MKKVLVLFACSLLAEAVLSSVGMWGLSYVLTNGRAYRSLEARRREILGIQAGVQALVESIRAAEHRTGKRSDCLEDLGQAADVGWECRYEIVDDGKNWCLSVYVPKALIDTDPDAITWRSDGNYSYMRKGEALGDAWWYHNP